MAHAVVQAAESIRRYCPEWYYSWLNDDSLETKIILKVDSEAKLEALSRDAFAHGINPAKIYDASRPLASYQLPSCKIDLLIKDLKLL